MEGQGARAKNQGDIRILLPAKNPISNLLKPLEPMKNLALALSLLLSSTLGAQDLTSYIPSDVSFLFTWNADLVGKKVNTRQLMQQESMDLIFQELVQGLDSIQQEEYRMLMTSPETYGINNNAPMHLAGRWNDTGHFYALLMPLSNAALLETFVARQSALSDEPVAIEQYGAYSLAKLAGYHLAWNQEVAVVAGGRAADIYSDFDWESYPYEEEYEYELDEEEIIEEEAPVEEEQEMIMEEEMVIEEYYPEEEAPDAVAGWIAELLDRSFAASLLSHPDYLKAVAKPADAHLWVDYLQFMTMGQDFSMMGGVPGAAGALGMATQMFEDMYKGTFLSMTMNFNKGELELNSSMLGQGKMIEVMQNAYDTRFNKKMWKYVDSRFLLGYYTIQVDVEKLVEGLKDIIYPAIAEMPMYGESFIRMMDVVGIVVDEDALYDLFKGDIFVALTGIRQAEIPVTSYEYDADFNPSQVEKIVKKQYPEFLVMTSYGNEENMRKLMRLGESFNVFLNMGDYYQAAGQDETDTYYLALKDGVMLFTNDGGLIEGRLNTGVEKAARLNKTHRKNLRKNVQAMYWDAQATWQAIQETGVAESDADMAEIMQGISDKVVDATFVTSRKVKPSIHGKMSLRLKDSESNALEQVVGLLNQLILEAAGLERI